MTIWVYFIDDSIKMLGLFEVFLLAGAGFANYFKKMLFSFHFPERSNPWFNNQFVVHFLCGFTVYWSVRHQLTANPPLGFA